MIVLKCDLMWTLTVLIVFNFVSCKDLSKDNARHRAHLRRIRSVFESLNTTLLDVQNRSPDMTTSLSKKLETIESHFRKLASLVYHQIAIQQFLLGEMSESQQHTNMTLQSIGAGNVRNPASVDNREMTNLNAHLGEINRRVEDLNTSFTELKRSNEIILEELLQLTDDSKQSQRDIALLQENQIETSNRINELSNANNSEQYVSRNEFNELQLRFVELESRLNRSLLHRHVNECVTVTALGLEDGRIPNSAITGSDAYSIYNSPQNARLNKATSWFTHLRSTTSYGESDEDLDWLKIDLGQTHLVTGVATQGSNEHGYYRVWVTRYKLSFSLDGEAWLTYKDGNNQIISANTDDVAVTRNNMDAPVRTRFVMFEPLGFDCDDLYRPTCYLGMRVEVYGCKI